MFTARLMFAAACSLLVSFGNNDARQVHVLHPSEPHEPVHDQEGSRPHFLQGEQNRNVCVCGVRFAENDNTKSIMLAWKRLGREYEAVLRLSSANTAYVLQV